MAALLERQQQRSSSLSKNHGHSLEHNPSKSKQAMAYRPYRIEIHEPSQPYHIPPRSGSRRPQGLSQPYTIPPRGSGHQAYNPYTIPPRGFGASPSYTTPPPRDASGLRYIPPQQHPYSHQSYPLDRCPCGCVSTPLMGSSPRYEYHDPGRYHIPPPSHGRRPPFDGAFGDLGGLQPSPTRRRVRVELAKPRQSIVDTFFGTVMVNPKRHKVKVSVRF